MTNANLLKDHRHFLDISSLTTEDAREIIETAKKLKKSAKDLNQSKGFVHPDEPLQNKALAMIFEK